MIDLSKYKPEWVSISQINVENKMFLFRKEITPESVAVLAKSLAEDHQMFPIILWGRFTGERVVVAGLRRLAAAISLKWESIYAITIHESEASLDDMLRANFVENIERKTLTNLDIMFSCKKLSEMGNSNVAIGKLIGKDEKQVRRYIAIVDAPKETQDALAKGEISIDQASKPSLGLESEQGQTNKKYIVKTTSKGIDAKIKIEAFSANGTEIDAFIAEVKRAWKQALKVAAKRQAKKIHIKIGEMSQD